MMFGKLVLAILVLGRIGFAQTLQYSVHLADYGWQTETLKVTDRERGSNDTTHLAFDSSGRLYVGLGIRGDAKHIQLGGPNNIFRVLVLDSQTGKVESSHDYPTQSKERVGLNLTAKGELLLVANDKLQLIGDDGSPKITFEIPMPAKDDLTHVMSVSESPSGKTLLLRIDLHNSYFFRTDSLSLISLCEGHPKLHYRDVPETFSDTIQMDFDTSTIGSNRLWVGPLCGQSTVLGRYAMKLIEPILLNDSTLLQLGTSSENYDTSTFEVRKISGETLWSGTLPKHFLTITLPGGSVRVARDGNRFAEEDVELRGGNRVLDIGPTTKSMWVRIFDSQTGKQLGLVPVAKPDIREFALSPEGDRVATLSLDGGTLEVWRLAGED